VVSASQRRASAAELLKRGDIENAIWAVERSDAAGLVHAALVAGDITFDALRPHLLVLWQSTDYPCRRVSRATWLDWFRRAGACEPDLPHGPIRAWRAQIGDELGLSWTYDYGVVQRFHSMNAGRRDACILEADIPPNAIVAHIPDPERELIADLGETWPCVNGVTVRKDCGIDRES
jgi:hypothetical protein